MSKHEIILIITSNGRLYLKLKRLAKETEARMKEES